MAEYAHLSDPDPAWLAVASSVPSLYTKNIIEFRKKLFLSLDEANSRIKEENEIASESLENDDGVIVTDVEIKQDGHSIPCRTYVPKVKSELDEKPGNKFPLLYWLFGGGFCLGTLHDNDARLRNLALTLRIACVAVAYRLAPENPFPAAIDDAYAGLKWALANADGISLDISKGVLVGGSSAGANLSAVITHRSLKDDDLRGKITGQLLIMPFLIEHTAYPDKWKPQLLSIEQNKDATILPKVLLDFFLKAYTGGKPENAFNPDLSPLLAASFEGLPPAYIQVAGCDPLRDEAFLYEKVLQEAGVAAKLDVYPGVPHEFHSFAPTFGLSKKRDADFKRGIQWLLGRSK